MPREVMDVLTAHVESQLCKYAPLKDNCKTLRDQARLAKYLGKYSYYKRQRQLVLRLSFMYLCARALLANII